MQQRHRYKALAGVAAALLMGVATVSLLRLASMREHDASPVPASIAGGPTESDAAFLPSAESAEEGNATGRGPRQGTGSKTGNFEITYVMESSYGDNPSYRRLAERQVQYQDDLHGHSITVPQEDPGDQTVNRGLVTGTLAVHEMSLDGEITEQSRRRFDAVPPRELDEYPWFARSPLERLMMASNPVVDLGDVDALMSSGLVTETGTQSILGRTARVFEVDGSVRPELSQDAILTYTVAVDANTGIKLQHTEQQIRSILFRYRATDLELGVQIPYSVYSHTIEEDLLKSDWRVEPFVGGGSYPPAAASVLVPVSDTLTGGYQIQEPVYITVTEPMYGDPSVDAWAVTQEMTSTTNSAYALVVQAPNANFHVPPGLERWWPPFWADEDPVIPGPLGWFLSHTPVTLTGGVQGYSNVVRDPSSFGGDFETDLPNFKYHITWIPSDIRAVILGTSDVGSERDMIDLANAFIRGL